VKTINIGENLEDRPVEISVAAPSKEMYRWRESICLNRYYEVSNRRLLSKFLVDTMAQV
jgi:hypothetical protein